MVQDTEDSAQDEAPNSSPRNSPLSTEIGEVMADLREEVTALRNEVQALRRKEAPKGLAALLPREEAAEGLRVSIRTLDDMADAGEIQPVRIRGRVLCAPDTRDAYLQARAGGDHRG